MDNRDKFARLNSTTKSDQELAKFCGIFGTESGTKYFRAGHNLEEATTEHVAFLNQQWERRMNELRDALSDARKAKAELKTVKAELAAVKTDLDQLKAKRSNPSTGRYSFNRQYSRSLVR